MIAIIDYDAGNIRSVEKALLSLGEEPLITRDREEVLRADKVILPGVGAFGDAMHSLQRFGMDMRWWSGRFPFSASVWECSFCLSAVRRRPEWRGLAF